MAERSARIVEATPKPLSVGEFNRAVKELLEGEFPQVWIEGEIVGYKVSSLGHAYFDLRDDRENARVSCCLFKGQLSRSKASLRDGERVLIRARASIYPARGQFQLIVDTALPAGAGLAAAALEALKQKLAAEGLFATERKRKLPRFPRAIGVVTAQNSAAFADICRVAHRRWPVRIVVANTLVQGADAPARIVAAIVAIQRDAQVDVVILGRGGGSSDDLAAFNDESVARAIASCRVPVIAAIGHEVDHTVADLVADLRASTPSNAAELAVPEWDVVAGEITSARTRLVHAMRARVDARKVGLSRYQRRFTDPRRLTDDTRQTLDDGMRRIETVVRKAITTRTRTLTDASKRLERSHPKARVARDRTRLATLAAKVIPSMRAIEKARIAQFTALAARLDALSPIAILARGYSVVLADGKAVIDAANVKKGDALEIRLHRGAIDATVRGTRREN